MGKRKKGNICNPAHKFGKVWTDTIVLNYQLPNDSPIFLKEDDIATFLSELNTEKEKLNNTKSLLNSFNITDWGSHTTKMHKYGFVVPSVKYRVKTELVTQAWAKFYTILSCFDLIPTQSSTTICSVHLCEAPGAFVTSLNHFIQNQSGGTQTLNWTATTLNPYYEGNGLGQMIADDRFIINTLPNWYFGEDYTGNIMSETFLLNLKKRCDVVDLVTADGSIDCSENPGEQEHIVSLLILWEVINGLSILSDNGCFVLKIFTVFEKFTISLLYLLKSVFKSSTLCKPGPSKPGNSEVYVVNQGFKKDECMNSITFQTFLVAAFKNDYRAAVIDLTIIPEAFLVAVRDYVKTSCTKQAEAIQENIELFDNLNTIEELELKKMKNYIANTFIKEFQIQDLSQFISLASGFRGETSSQKSRRKRGSFNDRQYRYLMLNVANNQLNDMNPICNQNAIGHQSNTHAVSGKDSNQTDAIDYQTDLHEVTDIKDSNETDLVQNLSWYFSKTDSFDIKNFTNFEFITGKSIDEIKISYFCTQEQLEKWKLLSCNKHQENTTAAELQQLKILIVECVSSNLQPVILDTPSIDDWEHVVPIFTLEISSKKEMIRYLQMHLVEHNFSPKHLVIQLSPIPVTFFDVGLCFLFTQCCQESSFFRLANVSDKLYMICKDIDKERFEVLNVYIKRLFETLTSMENDKDVLHVVPIYCLLQSNFQEYASTQIKQYIDLLN